MKRIWSAAVLFGLCSVAGLATAQDSEKKPTRAAVLDSLKDLKGVELSLWHHSGEKSEGFATIIRGDGTVMQSWTPDYPLTPEEKTSTRTFRIAMSRETVENLVRLVAQDDVLALPKIRPDLVAPKEVWPKSMRYSLGLAIRGGGSFEGEHPDIEWSKLPQSEAARTLIQAIRTAVQDLARSIERQDKEFLTKGRLLQLREGYFLELGDVQGLWGGTGIRVHADGRVEGVSVRPPKGAEKGMQVRHFKGSVDRERVSAILKKAAEAGTFDVQPKRATGVPDETRPVLELVATVDGAAYSRSIAMWDGEARETPAFQILRKALHDIAVELQK